MLRLIRRVAVSLLGSGIALVAAFRIVFRVATWQLEMSDVGADGQAGMGPFFGAVFLALVAAALTFALLFRLTRTWR